MCRFGVTSCFPQSPNSLHIPKEPISLSLRRRYQQQSTGISGRMELKSTWRFSAFVVHPRDGSLDCRSPVGGFGRLDCSLQWAAGNVGGRDAMIDIGNLVRMCWLRAGDLPQTDKFVRFRSSKAFRMLCPIRGSGKGEVIGKGKKAQSRVSTQRKRQSKQSGKRWMWMWTGRDGMSLEV